MIITILSFYIAQSLSASKLGNITLALAVLPLYGALAFQRINSCQVPIYLLKILELWSSQVKTANIKLAIFLCHKMSATVKKKKTISSETSI